jgi:benzylsuccinate CoA-transferase BbsF subunit
MSGDVQAGPLPLQGYRVLDFCWVWAGPAMTHLLADLGAEVLKVESRSRLDGTRLGRPIIGDASGDEGQAPELQPLNHGLNRNKLSITVNLSKDEGRDLLRRIVPLCDVVTDNFSAGVMRRNGLGYDALKELRADVIALSLSGAGQDGPLSDILTIAPTVSTLAGLSYAIGYPGEDPLGRLMPPYGDTNGSLHGVFAILLALEHRERTGEGQFIDLSQWEAAVCGLEEPLLDYQLNGRVARSVGNAHPLMAPHGNYRCAGDDRWVAIAVASDDEWRRLGAVIGEPWCAEDRFADGYRRLANRAELDASLEAWTSRRTPEEVAYLLQSAGIAAATVMTIEDQFLDEHFRERQMHVEVEHPLVGLEMLHGIPWRLSRTPGAIRTSGPLLGQHNEYVFGSLLGMTAEEIEHLVEAEVLY